MVKEMKENQKGITMEEFNQKYKIWLTVKAIQPAFLGEHCNKHSAFHYGEIEEIVDNYAIEVHDRETGEIVFSLFEEGGDYKYLEAIKEKFKIVDLTV